MHRQHRPPAEIIVVDDASDDGSADKLVELASSSQSAPVIRTIRLASNDGPASARNAGWASATQPYIAFLDADDVWHPRKLELQFGWMEAHPDSVLTGHPIEEANSGHKRSEPRISHATPVTAAMLLASNRFQTTSVILRRSIRQRFAEGKRFCEDYLLWLEIVLAGGQAHYLDASLALRFKPVYGAEGASGQLWKMEQGELDALTRVWRAGLLGSGAYAAAATWSWLRFLRRLAVVRSR